MAIADRDVDVLVVGGGIAGSALALVLARRGVNVTVLERQSEYHDRVRGEYMQPWGVAEAQRLGILDVIQAAGGFFANWMIPYDETVPSHIANAVKIDMTKVFPDVPGPICAGHPAMCRALSSAAAEAGARYLWNASSVRVRKGSSPAVAYSIDGQEHEVNPRLVVGADGRASSVRSQIELVLQQAPPTHLISGMLVDGVADWPQDAVSIGTHGDVQFFIFPQGGKRARLYTSTALDQRERYAGRNGPDRFLDDFRGLGCVPQAEALGRGTPIGPCATYDGDDSWIDVPFVEGVVLVGDAAGYNDPIIGEGLSLALRDIRVLTEILLGEADWSTDRLQPYAAERRERMRRMRSVAAINAAIFTTFGPEGAARRARFFGRMRNREDPASKAFVPNSGGPDSLPESYFTEEYRAEVLR